MTKITIEFQDENSTEFKVDAVGLTHRQLLVLARALRQSYQSFISDDIALGRPVIAVDCLAGGGFGPAKTTSCVKKWQLQLVSDEFYLAAQHRFFAIQNQAVMQAAQERQANQIAIAKLQQSGRGNSGLAFPRGPK